MKFIIIFFLHFNLLFADNEPKFKSTFGFLSGGTLLASFKDARVAVRAWLEDIATEYNGELNVEFYSESQNLYGDLKKGKLDMIVLDPPFFFKHKKDIMKNSANYWSLTMNNTKYTEYYLISKKSDKINSFKNIKNKKLSIKKSDTVPYIWLDKNSLKVNKNSAKKVLKDIKYERKESTALLNVFFKKTDFAVISKKTWDTMVELNPSLEKKLKVVKSTEKIHYPFIGLFSKEAAKGSVAAFFNLSENLKNLSGSEQIISLLKFDYIFRVDEKTLEPLEEYYEEYFDLQKRYK